MKDDNITFEEGLEKLEKLVASLEKGDLTLDNSLQKFREGMELIRHCRKLLTEAEYRVEMILQDGNTGEVKLQD